MSRAFPIALVFFLQACAAVGTPQVVYLARHGQTEWNRVGRFQGDPDLDVVGYLNRVSLWRLLRKEPIAAIYTSERIRTRRTAELVARQHKVQVEPRAALNEIDDGAFEGLCYSQLSPGQSSAGDRTCEVEARGSRPEVILPLLRKHYAHSTKDRVGGRFPLGENTLDVVRRTEGFVEELERSFHERQILIVGHGVINRVLLHHFMRWPVETVSHLRQENDQVFRLEASPAGVQRLLLYTPGTGWRECRRPPQAGERFLDCNPGPPRRTQPPPPASQPAASQPTS
jgi:broad specificity phosphatase PhoE